MFIKISIQQLQGVSLFVRRPSVSVTNDVMCIFKVISRGAGILPARSGRKRCPPHEKPAVLAIKLHIALMTNDQ